MQHRDRNRQKGFTLLEAVISMALLAFTTLMVMQSVGSLLANMQGGDSFVVIGIFKQNLSFHIQNDAAWLNTMNHDPTAFSCILNSTGPATSPGCTAQDQPGGYPFALYDGENNLIFDPASLTAGMTLEGKPCDEFAETGGILACPIRPELKWRPRCPGGGVNCQLPLIEVTMDFKLAQVEGIPNWVNVQKLRVQVFRSPVFCPNQVLDPIDVTTNWVLPTTITSSGFDLQSTSATTWTPLSFAKLNTQLFACGTQKISFRNPVRLLGGATNADADNQASFCVAESGGVKNCLFEWRLMQGLWSLWKKNSMGIDVQVFAAPGNAARLNSRTIFSFEISGGLVRFYVDGLLRYVFDSPWTSDYIWRATPAPTNYSAGILLQDG